MNNPPGELASFLAFFQLNCTTSSISQTRILESAGHIYSLILSCIEEYRENSTDEYLLAPEFPPFQNNNRQDQTLQLLTDSINATFGGLYKFTISSVGHVTLLLENRVYDLFPFFLAKDDRILWLTRCQPGTFIYADASGAFTAVESSKPFFEELLEGFMEKRNFRLVLQAVENISESVRKNYENKIYSAHCFLGCEYYKTKRYRDAISEFEQAMKIKANMGQLYYNLALSHARLQSYRTAIQLLNQLSRIRPNQSKTYELLGDFYFQLSDLERARLFYEKASELSENKLALTAKLKRVDDRNAVAKSGDGKKDREEEKEERFTVQASTQDLTLAAELGQFESVIGREKELVQMQEILACQSKRNVLLVGEAGVGKTALVQEFAYRVAAGKVSPRFAGKKIIQINMGAMLAGAKFRGQFEERVMHLISDLRKQDCILFIDDLHQIMAGGSGKSSSMEAAHFLKPALTNHHIQIIGTTNFEEFRNTIEKDGSFLRWFQILKMQEPDDDTLLQILKAYRSRLENYHHVLIDEESLDTTLMWVKVLLRERALPDKALDILDRAAARVSIQEKAAIVSAESVLETISDVSNIPLNRMSVSETAHYRNIEGFLSRRVIGQRPAVSTVSKVLCTAKLRMSLNPGKPKGIFLFVGPTGVGKTELAKAIAEFLFGQEEKIVRIDMSEYMERYSASRLIGTSPGYVGYYDQNQLVDRIRANPHSLVLLDEIEKADAQLLNIFLQVFDAGRLTDGKGKIAYFDNSTIVMTSNIGTHLFAHNKLGYGAETGGNHVTRSDLLKEVKKFFQPEFLNRIDEIVFFTPLTLENVRQIAIMKLASIFDQLQKQGKQLHIEDLAMMELCRMGYDYEYGARNLERVLRRTLLDKLAQMALTEEWTSLTTIRASWENNDIVLKTMPSSGLQEIINTNLEEQDFLEE